jgi:hypothetical protein
LLADFTNVRLGSLKSRETQATEKTKGHRNVTLRAKLDAQFLPLGKIKLKSSQSSTTIDDLPAEFSKLAVRRRRYRHLRLIDAE